MSRKLLFALYSGSIVFLCIFAQSSYAARSASIGDVSNNLFTGADILAKLFWAACIIVGIALIIGSVSQYFIHRSNPKLVPLTTPIMYLFLGIITLAIPFLDKIFGVEDAYDSVKPKKIPKTVIQKRYKQKNIHKPKHKENNPRENP